MAKDVQEFELQKEQEKKRSEEERKRLRRDRMLFEKSQKDKKVNFGKRAQDEIDELQAKVSINRT